MSCLVHTSYTYSFPSYAIHLGHNVDVEFRNIIRAMVNTEVKRPCHEDDPEVSR